MGVVRDFFAALPEVFQALWEFGEGWQGAAVSVGSVVLIVVFAAGAYRLRGKVGWVAAFLGAFAAFLGAFWLFGILPSAWVFFADGERLLLEGTVIPAEIAVGGTVLVADFYNVFRDSVVMGVTFVAIAAMAFVAVWTQKRFPRALAPDEPERASTHAGQ